MLWMGEVEDAKSIDDIITSALLTETHFRTSRISIWRLQANSGKSKHETSRNKSPQLKAKLNQRSDHLQADRLLGRSTISSKLVAKMKPSWTSEIRPSTQSGTKYDHNNRRPEIRPLQIEVDGPKRSRAKKIKDPHLKTRTRHEDRAPSRGKAEEMAK